MALHHETIDSHLERMSKLKRFKGNYDLRGLELPLPLSNKGIFEQNNNIYVAIGRGKKKLYILIKSKFDYQRRTTNLLPIVEDEKRH